MNKFFVSFGFCALILSTEGSEIFGGAGTGGTNPAIIIWTPNTLEIDYEEFVDVELEMIIRDSKMPITTMILELFGDTCMVEIDLKNRLKENSSFLNKIELANAFHNCMIGLIIDTYHIFIENEELNNRMDAYLIRSYDNYVMSKIDYMSTTQIQENGLLTTIAIAATFTGIGFGLNELKNRLKKIKNN